MSGTPDGHITVSDMEGFLKNESNLRKSAQVPELVRTMCKTACTYLEVGYV